MINTFLVSKETGAASLGGRNVMIKSNYQRERFGKLTFRALALSQSNHFRYSSSTLCLDVVVLSSLASWRRQCALDSLHHRVWTS